MCGPNEADHALEIIDYIGKEKCNSLKFTFNFRINSIISQCDIYVGNDSFGHHIMSQSGKPCFIIMLDTPRAYTDYSVNQYKILPKNLSADSINHDVKVNPFDITVDQVLKKINKISF